jgi:phosphatidylserine/phosphatidylglycerophosphate/cardiolipin synthase-like enzyme
MSFKSLLSRAALLGSLSVGIALTPAAFQQTFAVQADVAVCFTLDGVDCGSQIVQRIQAARTSIDVQAYSFTDPDIVKALAEATKRGVKVRVVLDKENVANKATAGAAAGRSAVGTLLTVGIPVWIDRIPPIAHSKVILIDRNLVIGGSYNYSRAARSKNSENVTFITSSQVAGQFSENIETRIRASGAQFTQGELDQLR